MENRWDPREELVITDSLGGIRDSREVAIYDDKYVVARLIDRSGAIHLDIAYTMGGFAPGQPLTFPPELTSKPPTSNYDPQKLWMPYATGCTCLNSGPSCIATYDANGIRKMNRMVVHDQGGSRWWVARSPEEQLFDYRHTPLPGIHATRAPTRPGTRAHTYYQRSLNEANFWNYEGIRIPSNGTFSFEYTDPATGTVGDEGYRMLCELSGLNPKEPSTIALYVALRAFCEVRHYNGGRRMCNLTEVGLIYHVQELTARICIAKGVSLPAEAEAPYWIDEFDWINNVASRLWAEPFSEWAEPFTESDSDATGNQSELPDVIFASTIMRCNPIF